MESYITVLDQEQGRPQTAISLTYQLTINTTFNKQNSEVEFLTGCPLKSVWFNIALNWKHIQYHFNVIFTEPNFNFDIINNKIFILHLPSYKWF